MTVDSTLIDRYLEEDLDTLLALLGKELDHVYLAAYRRSIPRLMDIAKNWLRDNTNAFKKRICGSDRVRSLLRDNHLNLAVVAIVDLISVICVGVSPITVAVLIVKIGVEKLCRDKGKTL